MIKIRPENCQIGTLLSLLIILYSCLKSFDISLVFRTFLQCWHSEKTFFPTGKSGIQKTCTCLLKTLNTTVPFEPQLSQVILLDCSDFKCTNFDP